MFDRWTLAAALIIVLLVTVLLQIQIPARCPQAERDVNAFMASVSRARAAASVEPVVDIPAAEQIKSHPRLPPPINVIPHVEGFACEKPYSDNVRFHLIIPILSRRDYVHLKHLGMLGLSGADIFVYIREDPNDTLAANVELPCGMRFRERLLLPNIGEEAAAVFTHVASVYEDPPDAVALLHGGPLHVWHALCSVVIRRLRAFYRGLGTGNDASTRAMRAFAQNIVTLNSCDNGYNWGECCGPLFCKFWPPVQEDLPQCPWELVGRVAIDSSEENPRALCQLRDRTPDSNWTLLSTDIPEFFMNKEQTLRKYESDPQQRVPITHPRITPPLAQPPPPAREDGLQAVEERASKAAAPASDEGASAAGPRRNARRRAPSSTSSVKELQSIRRGLLTEGEAQQANLTNAKDDLLPRHRAADLKHGIMEDRDIYDVTRFWDWMVYRHGFAPGYQPRQLSERYTESRWCCLQFVAPRHVLLRRPKAFWLDGAFLATHIAWRERAEWPVQLALPAEWGLYHWLDQGFMDSALGRTYLDVEREMGEDAAAKTCSALLAEGLHAES